MDVMSVLVDGGLVLFFGTMVVKCAVHYRRLFLPRYGRAHRLIGLVLLLYLLVGMADARRTCKFLPSSLIWPYDALLSIIGAATAISAARDFGPAHRRVTNEASGVLDEAATVTHAEMLEHSFYQGLNLVQISFLHLLPLPLFVNSAPARAALALLATAPWLLRSRFPVNSFSKNYSQPGIGGKTALVRVLYRMKKYQYLLYKHALLHGLNASVAVHGGLTTSGMGGSGGSGSGTTGLATSESFRLYWLCLNTAYVFEFFMQTLVKRGYLSQSAMLVLQQALMLVSTSAALSVLVAVRAAPALLSLGLNLTHRGQELTNFACVLVCAWLLPPSSAVVGGLTLSL